MKEKMTSEQAIRILVKLGIQAAADERREACEYAVEAIRKQDRIVHCRECSRWSQTETRRVGKCEYAGYLIGENGYCLYGERKNGDV